MTNTNLLSSIGVYGYDEIESIVLAALVTEDPLLLIGKAGTGKTYLLNSLSEALGLEHRHYNASLIAFDDLVGFPYPEQDNGSVRYLETPATVWQAESVLVDEISRCKPEHQNRLFSLVHERRIQGIRIEKLRYRWAAMNPCDTDQGAGDCYEGSVALDQALADRFAFLVEVPDWSELDEDARKRIADPRGEGVISVDTVGLRERVAEARTRYAELTRDLPGVTARYAVSVATLLGESDFRLSPRRVRQLVKNLLAVAALREGRHIQADYLQVLTWTFPHRAWGRRPPDGVVTAAHRTAWDNAFKKGEEAWLNAVALEPRLKFKLLKILREIPDRDTGALAVTRTLHRLKPEEKAVFAFVLYPVALQGHLDIGKEALADLGAIAQQILEVDARLNWQERLNTSGTEHPQLTRLAAVWGRRRGARRERARQIFYYLLANDIVLRNAEEYEEELQACVSAVRDYLRRKGNGKARGASRNKGKASQGRKK